MLTEVEKSALKCFYIFNKMTIKERPDIPPTREELNQIGVAKKILKKLQRKGILNSETLIVNEHQGNSPHSVGRVTYNLTKEGMCLCHELAFDKS